MMMMKNLEILFVYILIENRSFMNNNSIMLIDKQMTVKYFSNVNIFGPASCKIFEKIAMIVQKSIIVKML
jgi:hypothetical protein